MDKKILLIVFTVFLISNAFAFTVEPNRISYAYSNTLDEKQFTLPTIEIKNDGEAKHLSVIIECEKNFDCLKDYCSLPSNLFLLANETKQVQFSCILLPLEERILVGRALFLPKDSNSSDQNVLIELVKATSIENEAKGLTFESVFGKDDPMFEFDAGEHHVIVLKSHLAILLGMAIVLYVLKRRG